ncbi:MULTISPECIES: YbhB/YbcL family Raf kinase inhibitor-like protein [Streptomyces]|uniref:YbhB/YbcL family Raf kinase inhibitor-like protein n=1 Tax=Streptomyces katrae TaxID=68223 RepID=A0ABT7GWN5_9ACTN|nr:MULTISPECIES: YbhB/YbcL family Raf kinase inhibitor-like protein [Streptomyces]MDK9498020.1 YbhB/YbcL family Raf kinase inhibitor-like protein [Streptomyces katrae]GLX20807.1 kinase inhibitor [Streptomyces lavendulae subsp. lavendulae]GLX28031.1 kinase inhibitor [Streptomyces lavendulae subsp. lavendulae]
MKVFSNTFDAVGHGARTANRNPHVAWSDVPEGTRSLVLAAVDVGVPAEFDHWVLVDIDPRLGEIAEGALGEAAGRSGADGPRPPRSGGPAHRYVFLLYATDLERVPLGGTFTAADVLEAIDGHVLDEASFTGHYSLDPSLV